MNLANSYFLLFHGEQVKNLYCTPLKKIENNEEFFQILALLLSSSRKSFQDYYTLNSFAKLCSKVSLFVPSNIHELNILQFSLIEKIEANLSYKNLQIIEDTFCHLKEQKILTNENHKKLQSLFDFEKLNTNDTQIKTFDTNNNFKETKKDISSTIETLLNISQNQIAKKTLQDSLEYLNEQKFSIGVTGVMNAGKSTMLNALLGKEILGTSVVPETANLSILKYSSNTYAKVNYWNKAQWEEIENTSKTIESIKEFVTETKEYFKEDMKQYIQEKTKVDTISLDELPTYTSAKSSSKKSNLVNHVELGVNLEFLKDGVQIVDTPGLDDPVIQREEITKEYITKCDLLLHLMNVSQSATLKDMEFLVDALVYQNVTKLLIVLTKADTVQKDELHEVIEYVKKSLRVKLQENHSPKLEKILQELMIVPISSQMALLHKTGKEKEALNKGYNLEDTGILDIENYLYDTLFGKNNQRTQLITTSTLEKIKKAITIEKDHQQYTLIHLNKSTQELEEELKHFKEEKAKDEQSYKLMQTDINTYKNSADIYMQLLETFLDDEFETLKQKLLKRITNDIRYSIEKTKNKPDQNTIKTIVQTTIKDGVIDIIRDYRYKFVKKSETIYNQCKQKYTEFGLVFEENDNEFDAISFFGEEFISSFLTSSNQTLISKVQKELNNTKVSKLDNLDKNIQEIIENDTQSLKSKLIEKANRLSLTLLESFFKLLNKPLEQYNQTLQEKENTLKTMIETSKQTKENKDDISIKIHETIQELQTIEKRCQL